jgi:LysR family transcriptional regulator, transcriptional activator of the cysJI operon
VWFFTIRKSYDSVAFVTLANLRLIRDVAHHHSVSKAAHVNGITQSAASQRIRELETQLGVELFDHRRRPLTVTAAGKLYLDYCRDVLRRHDELEATLHELTKDTSGTVRLAAIYSVGLSEVSGIEARFEKRFPDAELRVAYLRPEKVFEAVVEDEADFGLVSYAESSRDVVAVPWREQEMVVAVAPTHRLAKRKSIAPSALEGELFVGFDEDLPINNQIERYFREHKVNVEMALHFDNLQMIKEAVAHGAGISIVPKRAMREELMQRRIVALRLDPAELYRPVRIIHRRRKVFSKVSKDFLALLREGEVSNAA